MEQWEYAIVEWLWNENWIHYLLPDGTHKRLKGSYAEVVELLTRLGQEGWEVVSAVATGNWILWTLKRQKDSAKTTLDLLEL
jgi:hypothetical protein